MSSEAQVISGKDDFPVSQLVAALKENHTLVHNAKLDNVLGPESNTKLASRADWEKFYAAIKEINAPVSTNVETPEQRGAGTVIAAIALGITIAQTLWSIFSGWDDKAGRSQWTQDLVRSVHNQNPTWNYVVVHTNHSINFDGVRGQDWYSDTYNYSLRIGSVRYTLYGFRRGVFSLHGDGGFLNWAFIGRVVSADPDSRRPRNVVFN